MTLSKIEDLSSLQTLLLSGKMEGVDVQVIRHGVFLTEFRGFVAGFQVFLATVDQDGGDTHFKFQDEHFRTWSVEWHLNFNQSLTIIRSDSQKEFKFYKHCSHSWEFGVANDFPSKINEEVQRMNQLFWNKESSIRLSGETNDITKTFTVVLSEPLITTLEELEVVSSELRSKIGILNEFVEKFKSEKFFGAAINSWNLVLYFNTAIDAADSARTIMDKLSENQEMARMLRFGTFTVKTISSLLYIVFHEAKGLSREHIIRTLQNFYHKHFDKYEAKIWDNKGMIPPLELKKNQR